jgi:dihydrofolate reductase
VIGIIAAVSPEWVIGVDGKIPWHYPADLARFKALTMGSTVIMGRLTWESIPARSRPLPGRTNIVVSSKLAHGWDERGSGPGVVRSGKVWYAPSVREALKAARLQEGATWFIGGARVYAEGMKYADVIELTHVPDRIDRADVVWFPPIDEAVWEAGPIEVFEDDARLRRQTFTRRRG